MPGDYQLVQLANGAKTLFSASYGEKMHPGLGPRAEAELLYVRQLQICERLKNHSGEFVIWDVGLGAAANAHRRPARDERYSWKTPARQFRQYGGTAGIRAAKRRRARIFRR